MNRKPLQRKTGLTARKGLTNNGGLLRSGGPKRTAPMPRKAPEPNTAKPPQVTGQPVPPSVRAAVYKRDNDTCQRCGLVVGPGNRQLQHRVPRGAGGRVGHWRMSALVLLHGHSSLTGCHGEVESQVDQARRDGFRVPVGIDPATHPMRLWTGQWVLLDDDGGVTPCEVAA